MWNKQRSPIFIISLNRSKNCSDFEFFSGILLSKLSNYCSFSKIGRKNHYLEILPQSSRIFFLVFSLVRFWILQSESGESVKFIQKSDLCCVFHWWLYIDPYCYLDYLYHIRIFSPWNQYWKECKIIHIWFSDQNFAFIRIFSESCAILISFKSCHFCWNQNQWQHFWKKWGLRNCLLKINGL